MAKQTSMNVVLDLGANIDCNEQNLIDFAEMGSLYIKLYFQINYQSIFIECWI